MKTIEKTKDVDSTVKKGKSSNENSRFYARATKQQQISVPKVIFLQAPEFSG